MLTGNSPRPSRMAATSRSLFAVKVPWLRWPLLATAS
jgi:hypothetical protein